jgi:hypothetical protein
MFVVAEEAVLIYKMGDGRFIFLFLHCEDIGKHWLIFFDCAQQYAAHNFPCLIFFDYLFYGFGVFFPNLLGDEGRVGKHKVKIIMKFLWNVFRMVEVILKVIGVVFCELFVVLC